MTQENLNNDHSIYIKIFAQTDVGMVRQGNEDNFLAVDLSTSATWTADHASPPPELLSFKEGPYGALFAVSDGMGGALAGEVASQLAVTAVRDWMLQLQANPRFQPFAFHERLRLSVEQANSLINNKSQNNAEYAGMGATFTAAGVDNNILYLAQIGDSRAYLIRRGRIEQMTKDQSLVAQLVEANHITEEEAENHHYKNVILQALGATSSVIVVVDKVPLCRDDLILLCSDGLSGKVRKQEMFNILNACNGDLSSACNQLIQMANDRGGEDNITVMLMHFTGGALSEPRDESQFESHIVQRDPNLPDEIDPSLLVSEESTLSPEEPPSGPINVPKTTAVLSASTVASLIESATAAAPPPPMPPMPPPPMPLLPNTASRSYFPLIAASVVVVSIVLAVVYFSFRPPSKSVESPPKPPERSMQAPSPAPQAPADPNPNQQPKSDPAPAPNQNPGNGK
ncbi:MAG: protein phosphatase 2C domain-containing protein [Blastocatellia bacterium]|nr:protein phosphatase 2C domain-containing protein [Blastocatellia bacterium]